MHTTSQHPLYRHLPPPTSAFSYPTNVLRDWPNETRTLFSVLDRLTASLVAMSKRLHPASNISRTPSGGDRGEELVSEDGALSGPQKRRTSVAKEPVPSKRRKMAYDSDPEPTESGHVRAFSHTFDLIFERPENSKETCQEAKAFEARFRGDFAKLDSYDAESRSVQISDLLTLKSSSGRGLYFSLPGLGVWDYTVTLPTLQQDDFNLEANDYGINRYNDVLEAALELCGSGRATYKAGLYIQMSPEGDPLICNVQVRINFYFLTPQIFEPLSDKFCTLGEAQRRVLDYVYRDLLDLPTDTATDVNAFYQSLLPAPHLPPRVQMSMEPPGLTSTLLPFQRHGVHWLLRQEGLSFQSSGRLVPCDEEPPLPHFWSPVPMLSQSGTGKEREQSWWRNVVTGELLNERPKPHAVRCALLAEEPGLGKTVESIALILYNTPSQSELGPPVWSNYSEVEVTPVRCSLIVTPATLIKQWADELKRHAPNARVLIYEGWASPQIKKLLSSLNSETAQSQATNRTGRNRGRASDVVLMEVDQPTDWASFVAQYDVVLTTYPYLQKDLNVARPPVKRPRREVAAYQPSNMKWRSPLVLVEWQRVLMDEVQQAGTGKAAEMVSLIPRRSSIAVSGTPAKAKVEDLIGVLRFMRVHPILDEKKAWNRLLKPRFFQCFSSLFQRHAIRTHKADAEGLKIPKQTRFVVPIALGMIERHIYDQLLEGGLREIGLDRRGVAQWQDWELDAARLRATIRRLRMACIHPQVGNLNAQAGGQRDLGGAIRPIDDVLATMLEENWQAWMSDRRTLLAARLQQVLLELRAQKERRPQLAIPVLLKIRTDILSLLSELEAAVATHDHHGRSAAGEEALTPEDLDEVDIDGPSSQTNKGKGKAILDQNEGLAEDEPKTISAKGEERRRVRQALITRLRELEILHHRIEFVLGDTYHQSGNTKEEDESYGRAEALRRKLLKSTEDAAKLTILRLTHVVGENEDHHGPAKKRVLISPSELQMDRCMRPGIKSEALFDDANIIMDVLDEQAILLFRWRDHLHDLLTRPITSNNEDADGQEYQRTIDSQGEVECYLKEYAALLADRREVLTLERTVLAAHDDRERQKRHTKAAARAAEAFDLGLGVMPDGMELDQDPEMVLALRAERKDCRTEQPKENIGRNQWHDRALKSIMVDLNKIEGSKPEIAIAKAESVRLRRLINDQTTLIDRLYNELALFRAAFNGRVSYFRQLQELSDSVQEVDAAEGTLEEGVAGGKQLIKKLGDDVTQKAARQRFFEFMAKKSGGELSEDDRECGICTCTFDSGLMLSCGHIFCDECFKLWRRKGQGVGSRCSTCRQDIDDASSHRFTFSRSAEEQAEKIRQEEEDKDIEHSALKSIRYNMMDRVIMEDIASVESVDPGLNELRYGSKITQLVRHLLFIDETEPHAKSIVFSAWSDSLLIIEHALRVNGISCIRIDANSGRRNAAHEFQNDPHIKVLLLHGERENSGLNLTCAQRIMLVEPTVNSAFEIQAIARVDRLGQTKETEVYCYYAVDTVEQNILDVAARKGKSLYTVDNASRAVNLASMAIVEKQAVDAVTRDKSMLKGDFIAGSEQMLEVLFPEMFINLEDLEMEDVQPTQSQERSDLPYGIPGPSS